MSAQDRTDVVAADVDASAEGPLRGIRVLDCSTLFAGPTSSMLLGDYGADVIKVEHPTGDPARNHGVSKDGVGLWAKVLNRNKKTITLNLSRPRGQELLIQLVASADVLIENFRPGTLEKWNLGYDRLRAVNPKLILARITAFGQFGPYSRRPGFGTLAEAMSGFAHITGEADGPPTLPPFGLADGIAGLAATSAILMALLERDRVGGSGVGQEIDLAIIDPILTVLGPQPTAFQQLGIIQQRNGNRSENNAPRNTYRTLDGRWVAVSTSAHSIAVRVMRLVGHPEVTEESWFQSGTGRAANAELLDKYVGEWIAERSLDDVISAFDAAEAAVAPVYDVEQLSNDPQYLARGSLVTVLDEALGPLTMQNVIFRLSSTPGRIRHSGRAIGASNRDVLGGEVGLTERELEDLAREGVV